MGILDEAIREHLELKRQHGAAEPELKQLEDEALGAPGGAGEIEQPPEMSDAEAEAPTDYIGSPAAAPPEQEEAGTAEVAEAAEEAPAPAPDLRPPEMRPEEPPPPVAEEQAEAEGGAPAEESPAPAEDPADAPPAPAEEEHPAMELEVPDAAEPDAAPEPSAEPEPPPIVAGGVSADLRAEREEIAQHPTEHYDVEDEIAEAEKEAAGFFNEQSLSDELDQALDSPDLPADEIPADAADEVEVEVIEDLEEPEPAEEPEPEEVPEASEVVEPEEVPEAAEVVEEEFEEAPEAVEVVEEEEEEVEVVEEDVEVEGEEPGPEDEASGAGEGEEDVLEETPDFLQDSPEHDRLWFEQKPPKDFDFDD